MATTEKQSTYREDFPGYQGHIPYKFSIIGKTVGATNETINQPFFVHQTTLTFLTMIGIITVTHFTEDTH